MLQAIKFILKYKKYIVVLEIIVEDIIKAREDGKITVNEIGEILKKIGIAIIAN